MADVVATSPGFGSTDAQREVWPVVAECAEGTALIAGTDRVGVAYTPSGGHTRTKSLANGIAITGIPDGGASLGALQCSVATDGSWEFAVTGVDGTTKNGTIVYAVVSSGQITSLTLTASTNKRFGTVNNPAGYTPSASKCLVKVGA